MDRPPCTSSAPTPLASAYPTLTGVTTDGPRLPRTYVPRQRLWAELDKATAGAVTLLVAPAGAGKTLGVGGWLRRTTSTAGPGGDAVWVDASAACDPARLESLLELSSARASAPPRLLVVDDAHELPAASVRLLDERLARAPQSMRMLVLSRWDLHLTRLLPELLGHLTVLRGDLLRMDDDEAAALVASHSRSSDPEVLAPIAAQAQGWCAALVLMSRAISGAPDPSAAARRYVTADARVADRVASEVFATLRPRERHLLLCTAHEGEVSVSTARHLSHDARAAEVLDDLETTGLLVIRSESSTGDESDPHYRIHPLLGEVIRRRMSAGGVDVSLARATVRRAIRLDLECGDTRLAFDRLVAVGETDLAAELLASEGVAMVMRGQGPAITAFVRAHPDAVAGRADSWFPVVLERWSHDDVEGARHWMDRVLAGEAPTGRAEDSVCGRIACIRLMRARLGLESLSAAVGHAQRVVLESHREWSTDVVMPLLLAELGATQNWTGDLAEAEVNLTTAIGLCRNWNLPVLAGAAAGHLAFTQYLVGRERASIEVAVAARRLLDPVPACRTRFETSRASLVALLADMVGLPRPTEPSLVATDTIHVHTADLCTRFWLRIRDARLALVAGTAAEAERILEAPLELPLPADELPEHLRVVLLVERAVVASLCSDQERLKDCELDLSGLDARGEAALVAGFRADLSGDRRQAATLFGAASADAVHSQPASRALALTCEAQLLDDLGSRDASLDLLREAATVTEARRNASPFLGWSKHGTPIGVLLQALEKESGSTWVGELASAAAGQPDVTSVYAATTATPRERAVAGPTLVRPVLSPRERDVLNELARGSTYADIAGNLFVSENTVKTHVSSLYSKLAASRRSEALAVARSLHLL